MYNSFFLSCGLCQLLIAFANTLDQDQNLPNVDPYLDANFFKLRVFLKYLFHTCIWEKANRLNEKHENLTSI